MTPEMRNQRSGKLTASMAGVIMGGLNTDGLKRYVNRLAFERLYGLPPDDEQFQSRAMDNGNKREAAALDWYAFETDSVLLPGGECLTHPALDYVGASPDARRPDRTVQVKCPIASTWVEYAAARTVPAEYRHQCRWEMWVAGVTLCDFVVWHPNPGGFIVQFHLTDDEAAAMHERAEYVNSLIIAAMRGIQEKRNGA